MEVKNIHNQFHKILLNFISNRINDKDDAEDILQEVFIKITKGINSLDDKEKLKSWIFTITRNAITDYYRKNANKTIVAISENNIETQEEIDIDSTKGLDKCLKGFIQKLPDEYRDIIIDSELKGIKQKDLVDKYNLQYPTIRSRVQRGRSRLKDMLLNCCRIESDSRGNIIEKECKDNCNNCD